MSVPGEPASAPLCPARPRFVRARFARPGFTLIELLVVLAILGLITALAEPWLAGLSEAARFRVTAHRLVEAVQAARLDALAQGGPVRFEVIPGGQAFRSGNRAVALPQGFTLAASDRGGLRFFADGSSGGGALRLDGAGRSMRIEVTAPLGLVRAR